MVLGDALDQPALALLEEREVLDEVEQARGSQVPRMHRLQRDDAFLALVVDLLPLAKCSQPAVMLPTCGSRLPLERMMNALYQKSCGMVSL